MVRRELTIRVVLTEQQGPIDPERPVLRRCKVIGTRSENGRVYLEEALERAADLYEGARVNLDHPDRPGQQRGMRDRFGWLEGVRVEGDGLYADLHYNPRHPLAESVTWWAQNAPDKLGLSHNAVGTGKSRPDGVFEVHKIVEVRSVDLVADPATTKGLYESKHGGKPVKIKFKTWMERVQDKVASRLPARSRRRLARLVEALGDPDSPLADMGSAELEPPTDDSVGAESDPHDQITAGFKAAITAILDDDTLDAKAKAKKIAAYLKAHEDVTGLADDGQPHDDLDGDGVADDLEGEGESYDGDEDEEDELDDTEESEGEGGCGHDEEDEHMEGRQGRKHGRSKKAGPKYRELRERLDVLEAKEAARLKEARALELCEAARLPQFARTELFLEQLMASPGDREMRALIEDRKRVLGTRSPVSAGPGRVPVVSGREDFKKALFRGR